MTSLLSSRNFSAKEPTTNVLGPRSPRRDILGVPDALARELRPADQGDPQRLPRCLPAPIDGLPFGFTLHFSMRKCIFSIFLKHWKIANFRRSRSRPYRSRFLRLNFTKLFLTFVI